MAESAGPRRQVVYLTGAPATGKTTTARILAKRAGARVLSYGALLTERTAVEGQAELRERSADVIAAHHVLQLDAEMASMVSGTTGHCIIDSHAVTKERWGFRVVPYDQHTLLQIGVTSIVVLYADEAEITRRISRDPQGRPLPDGFDLGLHQSLQMSLALAYSHSAHVPAYFIRATGSPPLVATRVADACGIQEMGPL